MADDFFADLLPIRPKTNGASGEGRKEDSRPFEDTKRPESIRPKDPHQKQTQEVRPLHFRQERIV